jgi:membrane protease YdiL (CAAX protease family)
MISQLFDYCIRFILFLIFLFAIEFLAERFEKEERKKIKQQASLFFNWVFPLNKPFKLFCLPLIFILILESFALKHTLDVYFFLFSFTFLTQPLVEEIIFRGVIFGSLIKKLESKKHNKKKYIIYIMFFLLLQSTLFTFFHWETKPTAVPLVFLNGIIFGITFLLSDRNILVPTMMHIASNLFVFVSFIV